MKRRLAIGFTLLCVAIAVPAAAVLADGNDDCAVTASAAKIDTPAIADNAVKSGTQPLMAIKFHADWCGSCKALNAPLKDLQNKFDAKSVLFLTLDFTNQTTTHQAKLLAHALGLKDVVQGFAGKTGFVALIRSKNSNVLGKLDKSMSVKDMSAVLNAQLKSR